MSDKSDETGKELNQPAGADEPAAAPAEAPAAAAGKNLCCRMCREVLSPAGRTLSHTAGPGKTAFGRGRAKPRRPG
jgi:hypothetical protein